ncbi:MAG: hypothetical protein ABIL76_03060, partial [candidate division WOR-3 bacterium]
NEIKSDLKFSLILALKNFTSNVIKILILPIENYKGKFKKFLLLFFLIIHLIWFIIFFESLLRSDKFVIVLFMGFVISYSLYFVFGGFGDERFKTMILPFEIYIVVNYSSFLSKSPLKF